MGLGAPPPPPPAFSPTFIDVAAIGILGGVAADRVVNGTPWYRTWSDNNTTPITSLRQGSQVPAVVRSHPPDGGPSSSYRSTNARTRNHINSLNLPSWRQHAYPSQSSTHAVIQYDRHGQNLQRGSYYEQNSVNPSVWNRTARFDMSGPPHNGVPTPHVQHGNRVKPLNTTSPIAHMREFSKPKQPQ